ncbi:uncharacterized protein LOC135212301 [Macrobrachium nipponense]|uniref:uncharacterized protein LOC135212301 n=1 Tax=Macrobrachium nipponense TaxID=159736 RepID=UPI0030C8B2B3
MSDTKEDIENGNTKEAIEAQVQLNGDAREAHPEKQEEEEAKDEGKQQAVEGGGGGVGGLLPSAAGNAAGAGGEAGRERQEDKDVGGSSKKPGGEKEKGAIRRMTSFKISKRDEAWRKKKRAQLRLDIPSAQREIPVLSVIPATGSASRYSHYSLDYTENSTSSTTNSCFQCLFTAKLVWTLLLTVLDHITDAMAIERFFRTGHMLFFVLSLVFYVVPIFILCTYATNKLKRKLQWSWLDCVLNFFIAPYWLIIVNITNSLKNGRHQTRYEPNDADISTKEEILRDGKALATLHTLEGVLEATPQVYIQIAAYMTLPITK